MSRLFGPIDQVAWVVPDLQASMKHWADTLGVGPWFRISHVRRERNKDADRLVNQTLDRAEANPEDLTIRVYEDCRVRPDGV